MVKLMEINNHVLLNKSETMTEDYKSRNNIRAHRGIDMTSYDGNKHTTDYIISIEEGLVVKTGKNSSIGNYVMIKHPVGLISAYYHLKDNTIKVKKRQYINKGVVIGFMGNTGNCSGAHLHFGILKSTSTTSDIDPLPYLKGEKTLLNDYWVESKYILTVAKTIRTNCTLSPLNRVKVGEVTNKDIKPLLTSKNKKDVAMIKKGGVVNITKIVKDSSNRIWGKLKYDYIVLCNADGTPQAEKILN